MSSATSGLRVALLVPLSCDCYPTRSITLGWRKGRGRERERGRRSTPMETAATASRALGSVREREGERVHLTDAARRIGRQLVTIRRWIAAGEFSPAEARRVPERVRGMGQEWSISIAALERVNAA